MTDEQIVEAAKSAEKKTEVGKLARSKVSRGVNSAYGIGFLEGAEWARWQMLKDAVEFECIGKKVKMTIQELINYYIDQECCDVADECGF